MTGSLLSLLSFLQIIFHKIKKEFLLTVGHAFLAKSSILGSDYFAINRECICKTDDCIY